MPSKSVSRNRCCGPRARFKTHTSLEAFSENRSAGPPAIANNVNLAQGIIQPGTFWTIENWQTRAACIRHPSKMGVFTTQHCQTPEFLVRHHSKIEVLDHPTLPKSFISIATVMPTRQVIDSSDPGKASARGGSL